LAEGDRKGAAPDPGHQVDQAAPGRLLAVTLERLGNRSGMVSGLSGPSGVSQVLPAGSETFGHADSSSVGRSTAAVPSAAEAQRNATPRASAAAPGQAALLEWALRKLAPTAFPQPPESLPSAAGRAGAEPHAIPSASLMVPSASAAATAEPVAHVAVLPRASAGASVGDGPWASSRSLPDPAPPAGAALTQPPPQVAGAGGDALGPALQRLTARGIGSVSETTAAAVSGAGLPAASQLPLAPSGLPGDFAAPPVAWVGPGAQRAGQALPQALESLGGPGGSASPASGAGGAAGVLPSARIAQGEPDPSGALGSSALEELRALGQRQLEELQSLRQLEELRLARPLPAAPRGGRLVNAR
jgi:hypothetical protein